jgi:LacI family repressor for deo operon, udp, cdd, tsx, nupC, and nupG
MPSKISKRRVTMTDIAKKLGISQQAVSAALSGSTSTVAVGRATKARVRKLAEEMNYVPDFAAKSLSTKKSYLVAFLCRESFHLDILVPCLDGLQRQLENNGYSVLTSIHGNQASDELAHIDLAMARRADAIVLTPAIDSDGRTNAGALLKLSQRFGIPVIQVANKVIPELPCVQLSRANGVKRCMERLYELGHTRIVHLTYQDYQDEVHPGFHLKAREHWLAYESAMRGRGLEPLVIDIPSLGSAWCGDGQIVPAIDTLLKMTPRPTAILAHNDRLAYPAAAALAARGISIPRDLAMIGYDDLCPEGLGIKRLSTVNQPFATVGEETAKLVLEMIAGRPGRDIVLDPVFVERDLQAGQVPLGKKCDPPAVMLNRGASYNTVG